MADDYNFLGTPLVTEADYEAAVNALYIGFGPLFRGRTSSMAPWAYTRWSITPSLPRFLPAILVPAPVSPWALPVPTQFSPAPSATAFQLLSQYVTTYAYEFNDENAPPAQSLFGGFLNFPLGAYHTAELQYLFDDADFFGLPEGPLSPTQEQLSDAMISYWTRFAKTGNPLVFQSRSGLRTARQPTSSDR